MESKKTSQYFKYALGEIILVVLGILIALQINAWYQSRLDKTNELLLVEQMLFDAQADSLFFEERLYKLNAHLLFYNDILNLCNQKPLSKTYTDSIPANDQPFIKLANQSNLINNNPEAYTNLLNKELKIELQRHIAQYEFVKRSLDFYNLQIDQYVTPLRISHYPIMPYYASNVEEFRFICEQNETQGIMTLMCRTTENPIRHIKRFLESNTNISKKFREFISHQAR